MGTRKTELAEETWAAITQAMHAFRDSWLAAGRNLELNPGEMRRSRSSPPPAPLPHGRRWRGELRCDASNVTWLADRLEARGLRRAAPGTARPPGQDARHSPTPAVLHTTTRTSCLRVPPEPLLALSTSELRTLRDLMTKCWEQAPGAEG